MHIGNEYFQCDLRQFGDAAIAAAKVNVVAAKELLRNILRPVGHILHHVVY